MTYTHTHTSLCVASFKVHTYIMYNSDYMVFLFKQKYFYNTFIQKYCFGYKCIRMYKYCHMRFLRE